MINFKNIKYTSGWRVLCLIFTIVFQGCHGEFLDIKPDKALVVPETLKDIEGILNNSSVMNAANNGYTSILISDDYYMNNQTWKAVPILSQKKAYAWDNTMFTEDIDCHDWKRPYQQVFYANFALEQLEKIKVSTDADKKKKLILRASALFYRATAFLHLAQLYAKPYNENTSKTDLGIVLRLESDILVPSQRSSVEETYNQILLDLEEASVDLPEEVDLVMKPSLYACYGMMARVYLLMKKYELALSFAQKILDVKNDILDFKSLNASDRFPFLRYNKEVIFQQSMLNASNVLAAPSQKVSQDLLSLYETGDLRRELFYIQNPDGTFSFRGSYDNAVTLFNGITTSEIILIKAECLARLDKPQLALNEINHLAQYRFAEHESIKQEQDVLDIVLEERRRELAFRGLRWWDMRRLKDDPFYEIEYIREVDGNIIHLEKELPDFTLPIPDLIIQLSNIKQN